MTTYAYADRSGCINFGAQVPTARMVIAKSTNGDLLRDLIGTIAQHDRAKKMCVVPGMSTASEPDEALIALGKFQRRVERLLAEATP